MKVFFFTENGNRSSDSNDAEVEKNTFHTSKYLCSTFQYARIITKIVF